MMKHLIIGQGSIGKDVAIGLYHQGHMVTGMARTPKAYPDGVAVMFWQKDALSLTTKDVAEFDTIAIIITPSDDDDRVKAYQDSYLAVCQHIAGLGVGGRVLFVSSTSVYGQNAGEWVDEHTIAMPSVLTAKVLLDAENTLIDAYGERTIIVRPSGIYGKSDRMITLAKSAHEAGVPSHHYTNRIHHVDLAALMVNILTNPAPKPIYLISDGVSVTSAQLMSHICQTHGFKPPAITPSAPTGKRIIPNIDLTSLTFKSYKEGYARDV